MVNESELLINVVMGNKPKMLTGLNQKVKWSSSEILQFSDVVVVPSAQRQYLTYSGIYAERGKPIHLLFSGKQVARQAEGCAGMG